MYYVNASVVDIQKEPDRVSEVVTQALYAMELALLEEQGDWVHVLLPDTYTGWVKKSSLLYRVTPYAENSPAASVKTFWTHLFPVQSIAARPPLITAPFEAKLELEGNVSSERWQQVRLLDDTLAWVQRGDCTFEKKLLTKEELLPFSLRFLGLPYRWGGASSFGYDCSGFIQMLFRQVGILLPRDSSVQAACDMGAFVSKDALKEGDVVFFGQDIGQEKIDHVGLYLGEKLFIHAVAAIQPAVIQISKLTDTHWEKRYACARRFL